MNKKLLILSIFTYLIGVIIPFFLTFNFTDSQLQSSTEFLNKLQISNNFDTWIRILKTNFLVVVYNILGGLSIGVISFCITVYNGFILGYLIKVFTTINSTSFLLKHTLPHSVEIIAIILSCYLGYKFGASLLAYIIKNKKISYHKSDFIIYVITLFIVLISSIIEAYVSI